MAINTEKLLNKSPELNKRYSGRVVMQKSLQEKMVSGGPSNIVLTKKSVKNIGIIKVNVIEIENILKGTLASEKKSLDDKKRRESSQRREKQEEKLETKPNIERGTIKMPKAPRMGILDWIKNFIGNVLLGYFAVRLIDHLPKIMPIVKFIGKAADFLIDIGGKLLNGLATFIDWGYKAYDATRGFIKIFGGENFAQGFDKFVNALDTTLFLATFLAGDLLVEALSGDSGGGLGDFAGDQLKKRGAQQAATSVAGKAGAAAGKAGGIGAGAAAGIVAGAGLLSSALGEGAFQVRKIVVKPIQKLENDQKNDKNPLTRIGRGIVLNMVRPLFGLFQTVGFLLDVVGAPFRYAIELLRYPFLSEEDKIKQANNLAKFDARIREDLRRALNMLTLGFVFKEKGSFGNIYGNKGSQKEMMGKMAGGGITRGGKRQTRARRTIGGTKKGKYKRVLATTRKPGEIEIGEKTDVGQKEKVFDFFGFVKNAVNAINPFNTIKKSGEELGKTNYFGPILAITSKITLGQKPTQKDYENVGLGINMLVAKGIQEKQLKGGLVATFAEGGLVDPDVLSAAETGGDISNWVAKTFQGEIESNAQKTLRMIKQNSEKREKEKEEKETKGTPGTEDGFEVGPSGSSGDKLTMARNLMRDLKLTAAQAAGIVGNMAAESGVENARPQGSPPGTKAALKVDGLTGYGLVQWTSKGRQQALADFAKSRGADLSKPLSMDIEYQFFLKEFQGAYGNVLKQIRQAKDVKASSTIFMQQYEVPAGYKTEAKIMERYNMSKPIYDKLAAGQGKATEGAGTYIGPSKDSISLGKGYGSEGSKIAGELGRFMKKKGVVPGSIHRHPEHPPWSRSSGHSKNSYHYQGRAIDLGGYTREQGPILAAIAEFNKLKGVKPVELIHGGTDPKGHGDHVHVAYEAGGETLPYEHMATVSEGDRREIIVDNDSAYSSPQVKNMLLAINQSKGYKGAMQAIQQYAPYDALSQQTLIVPMQGMSEDEDDSEASGGSMVAFGGGGEDPFESLYQGG